MKTALNLIFACFIASILVACGGSSSGGGGGSVSPTLPADATPITTSNAAVVAQSAVDSFTLAASFIDRTEPGKTPPATTRDVIRLILDSAFSKSRQSFAIASGVIVTEVENCDSGTITATFDETATSAVGTIIFAACEIVGIFINGSFSFNSSWNNMSGAYSDSGSGSLSISIGADSFTMELNFSESGNEISGSYSTTMTMSVSGSMASNYLLTTTQPITGVGFDVSSGEILVSGGAGTRLRITVVSTNTAEVWLDDGGGTFVFFDTISLV